MADPDKYPDHQQWSRRWSVTRRRHQAAAQTRLSIDRQLLFCLQWKKQDVVILPTWNPGEGTAGERDGRVKHVHFSFSPENERLDLDSSNVQVRQFTLTA